MNTLSFTSVVGLLLPCAAIAGNEWPAWRGAHGDGIASQGDLVAEWSTNHNILWKAKIPGAGWSQPVVWDNRVFLTTAATTNQVKPKGGEFDPGLAFGGFGPPGQRGPGPGPWTSPDRIPHDFGNYTNAPPPPAPDVVYQWKVICLNLDNGQVRWEKTLRQGKPATPIHRNNTYASETPVTDGERLFAYFGMNGLYCLDFEGQLRWSADLGSFPTQFGWGSGSSPVLYEDLLYIQCDNDKDSFLAAIDKRTGRERWRAARQEQSNWSSPYVWKNCFRTELVTGGGTKLRSYDPKSGELLWELKASGRTAITPVGDGDFLYADSYDRMMGGQGLLVAIKPGAHGDISLNPGQTTNQYVAWATSLNSYRVASPLLYRGCLYQLDQQSGIVRCFDARTGALRYKERLPGTRGFTASPWASDGEVFCLDETGATVLLRAGPQFEILATNRLEETMWASAAIADRRILLRGVEYLYCIGK